MSRRATIEITDHESVADCFQYYTVDYKPDFESNYTRLAPNPIDDTIQLDNLLDDTVYDVRVNRVCCDNQISEAYVGTIDTTIP